MLEKILFKYSRIAEDILVDFFNKTLLRKGLTVICKNRDESLALLNKSGKSVIRWGDGESIILLRGDIYFQSYSPDLRMRLMEIASDYSIDSPYYLCLPSRFLTCSTGSLYAIKKGPISFYQLHKGTRYLYKRFFKKQATYLSHFLFKGDTQAQFGQLLDLLSRFKAFVVVKSEPFVVQEFFSLFMDNCQFTTVEIPGKNAFQSYETILENIYSATNNLNVKSTEILTLISAGPCAKVLVYDLSKEGVMSYDVGKFFECWLENSNCRQ